MKKGIVLLAALMMTFSVGAATGVKVTAELVTAKISVNGNEKKESVISYNGTTYVPLRKMAEMLDINVNYQSGVITVGSYSGNVKYIKDLAEKDYISSYSEDGLSPNSSVEYILVEDENSSYDASKCVEYMIKNNLAQCDHKHN